MTTILNGDCRDVLKTLPDESIHMVCTSPPYWNLRSYLPADHPDKHKEIGTEKTPEEYVAKLVAVFREVRRVLRSDGVCWLNLGSTYAANRSYQIPDSKHCDVGNNEGMSVPVGFKPKDLIPIPWMVAMALQKDGWWLRSDIIWAKPNCMPSSVTDRPTASHEYVFLLAKAERYFYDAEAVVESAAKGDANAGTRNYWPGTAGNQRKDEGQGIDNSRTTRNRRSVWTVATVPFTGRTKTVRWVRVEADAACDGMRRITSADCPVHGCPGRQRDEHEASGSNRIACIDGCHVQESDAGQSSISTYHGQQNLRHSLDSLAQPCLPFATDRNTETSKTAPALETIPPCKPSARTGNRNGRKQAGRESSGRHPDKTESNTSVDGSPDSPCNQMPDGTADKYNELDVSLASFNSYVGKGCKCSFYKETTEDSSHFATFPPALIEPMILAGCPAQTCPTCGKGWERVVERDKKPKGRSGDDVYTGQAYSTPQSAVWGINRNLGGGAQSRTLGHRPACACPPADPIPGVVLDPFGGSGTTGQVAIRLGRKAILIELNPEYLPLVNQRTAQAGLNL